jgi:hypothetical protein
MNSSTPAAAHAKYTNKPLVDTTQQGGNSQLSTTYPNLDTTQQGGNPQLSTTDPNFSTHALQLQHSIRQVCIDKKLLLLMTFLRFADHSDSLELVFPARWHERSTFVAHSSGKIQHAAATGVPLKEECSCVIIHNQLHH